MTQGQEIGQSSIDSPISVPQLSYRDAVEESNVFLWFANEQLLSPNHAKTDNNDQMVLLMKEKITTDATTNYRFLEFFWQVPQKYKIRYDQLTHATNWRFLNSLKKKCGQALTLKPPKEVQSKQIGSTRSRTKVWRKLAYSFFLHMIQFYNHLLVSATCILLQHEFDLKFYFIRKINLYKYYI